ncbi:MAG TPA: hypothetical protein VGL88_03095 [Pseudonocardiaceae bacterium]|jgi:hypothetical protein
MADFERVRTPQMMKARLTASAGVALLSIALGAGTASAATIAPAPRNVHPVYCQTRGFPGYVAFSTSDHPTPGGGSVCYDGSGTSSIGLMGVTKFSAGAHSGSYQFRQQPEMPIVLQRFSPHQVRYFSPAVEVISLTIKS